MCLVHIIYWCITTVETNARAFTPVKVTLCPNCQLLSTSLPVLIAHKELCQSLGGKHVWLSELLLLGTAAQIPGVREFVFVWTSLLGFAFTRLNGSWWWGSGFPSLGSQFELKSLERWIRSQRALGRKSPKRLRRVHIFSVENKRWIQDLGANQASTFIH